MVREKEGYKIPEDKKKQCTYCDRRISKPGWNMHMNMTHKEKEYVSFEDASDGKPSSLKSKPKPKPKKKEKSEDKSFPGKEGGKERESGSGSEEEDKWRPILKLE